MAEDRIGMNVRLDEDLYEALKERAQADDLSMQQVVRRALRRYLDDEGER